MESEKRCYVCQKYKPINDFYTVGKKIYNICKHDRNRLYCKNIIKRNLNVRNVEVMIYVNIIKKNMIV